MHQEEQSGPRQNITVVISLILLLIRIFTVLGARLIPNQSQLYWYGYYIYFTTYILISIVLWLNEESLINFNVDEQFVILLIFSGVILSIFYLPRTLGFFTGLATYRTFILFKRRRFKFSTLNKNYIQLVAIIVIALLPFLVLSSLRLFSNGFHESQNLLSILYQSGLPQSMIEEVMFRGALWMLLGKLNQSPWKIIIIQAILFLIVHLDFTTAPHLNLIWTLWMGVWLGIIVWRSKSLAPSTLTHFIADFLILIIRN
jgi:membrane protease YdiL (CAAX protease family)